MSKTQLIAALILTGTFCMTAGAATADRPVPEADWVQLTFAKSLDDCRLLRQAWRAEHGDTAATAQESDCFQNTESYTRVPTQRLPEYVFQVVSRKEPLRQPKPPADTLIYRSLGPAQLAKDQSGASPEPIGKGPVKYYEMLVFSKPTDGQEQTYNEWYDQQHVPDVIRNSGFISGQRFRLIDDRIGDAQQLPPYLVVFRLRSGSLTDTEQEIVARLKDGRTRRSPALGNGRSVFATPVD